MPRKKPQASADNSLIQAINIAVVDFKNFLRFQVNLEGYEEIPQIHFDAADFLQGWSPAQVGYKKKLMGFRLASKTTLLRWYVCWRWLRCPYLQVILHSSTNEIAKAIGKSILATLQTNPLLRHLAPPAGVAETQFNLNGVRPEQGYSLHTAGISTSLTGSRADIYIFDDPEPNIEPESMRTRILQAFGEARHILHRPDRHLHRMMNNGSPLRTLQPPEITQYIVSGQPHWIGSAYFPNEDEINNEEGHPLDDALEHRIDVLDEKTGYWSWPFMMERRYFNQEANRPMTVEEVQTQSGITKLEWLLQMRIRPEEVRFLGAVLKLQFIERTHRFVDNPVMTIDPADGGKCETACCIGGLFGNQIHLSYVGGWLGDCYEGDFVDGTLGESIWRRIFDMADEFHVGLILIEKNYKAAIAACRRYMSKSGRFGEVREFASTGQKLRRICKGLEQPINNGMVSAAPGVLEDGKTSAQFRGLRYDRLPEPCDRIDAVEMLVSHILENRATHSGGIVRMIPKSIQTPQFSRVGGGGNPFQRMRGR